MTGALTGMSAALAALTKPNAAMANTKATNFFTFAPICNDVKL
jgi:hypothetical protein